MQYPDIIVVVQKGGFVTVFGDSSKSVGIVNLTREQGAVITQGNVYDYSAMPEEARKKLDDMRDFCDRRL